MTNLRKEFVWVSLILLIFSGCTGSKPTMTLAPQPAATTQPAAVQVSSQPSATLQLATVQASPQPANTSGQGYQECAFQPGAPTIHSTVPVQTPTVSVTATLPASQAVDAATTAQQIKVYQQVWDDINENFVYPDFNGKDWQAIGQKYQTLINKGLSQANFYAAMQSMVDEVGDPMTFFVTPADQADQPTQPANFVGIGGSGFTSGDAFVLTAVMPGSPAEKGGLRAHDLLLKVDGGPVVGADGNMRTLGPKGSQVTITVRSPGQQPRDVVLVRDQIHSVPILSCRFSSAGIGYIHVLSWDNPSISDLAATAIVAMSKDAPLKGLIIDDRLNSGGYEDQVILPFLGLFTSGSIGDFLSRDGKVDTTINTAISPSQNLAGSQNIPLVVIAKPGDDYSVDIIAGVLQNVHRAKVVGVPMSGIVPSSRLFDLDGGSQLAVQSLVFRPTGLPADAWGRNGKIEPDGLVSTDWLEFTEENDPYIAKALELLK